MSERIRVGTLQVDAALYALVRDEIAPGTDVDPERIWRGLDRLVSQLEPAHRALLEKRDRFQSQLDQWHTERGSERIGLEDYSQFLREIGYVEAEADEVKVCTENVDSAVSYTHLTLPTR